MNEEIQFGMGMDTTNFARGLRSSQQIAKEGVSQIKDTLSEFGKSVMASFGAMVSVEGVRRVLEFGKEIERGAEIAGVSTDFYQTLGAAMRQTGGDSEKASKGMERLAAQIGEAHKGNKEAIQSFARAGVSITDMNGAALDTEGVMRNIADRIHGAATAEERAAIATEIFGKKLGLELIPALQGGSAALDKFGDATTKLSEADLKTLEQLHHSIDSISTTAMVWTGKLINMFAELSQVAGAFSGGGMAGVRDLASSKGDEIFAAQQAKKLAGIAATKAANVASLDEISDLAEELNKKQQEADFKNESKQEQLNDLERQKLWMKREAEGLDEGSAEWHQKQLDLQNLQLDIDKQALEVKKEKAQAETDAYNLQMQIDAAEAQNQEALFNQQEKKDKGTKLSLKELADSKINMTGTLGQDQQKARQIQELERQQEWNRQHGFYKDAQDRADSVTAIKKTLSDNVPIGDRQTNDVKISEAVTKSEMHLAELLKKAQQEGINVSVNLPK